MRLFCIYDSTLGYFIRYRLGYFRKCYLPCLSLSFLIAKMEITVMRINIYFIHAPYTTSATAVLI